MHQHLIDMLAALDASRQALRESMAAIPPRVRTARPGPDRWSPVDIVEHLSLVETRFSTVVGGKIAEALGAGLGPESQPREPLPERIRTMLADRTGKRTAPEAAIPTGALDEEAAWAAADKARAGFRTAVLSADGRALERRDPRAPVLRAAQCVSVGRADCRPRNAPRGAGPRGRHAADGAGVTGVAKNYRTIFLEPASNRRLRVTALIARSCVVLGSLVGDTLSPRTRRPPPRGGPVRIFIDCNNTPCDTRLLPHRAEFRRARARPADRRRSSADDRPVHGQRRPRDHVQLLRPGALHGARPGAEGNVRRRGLRGRRPARDGAVMSLGLVPYVLGTARRRTSPRGGGSAAVHDGAGAAVARSVESLELPAEPERQRQRRELEQVLLHQHQRQRQPDRRTHRRSTLNANMNYRESKFEPSRWPYVPLTQPRLTGSTAST